MQHVFIIGAGRSGTKFLRDVLAASDDVSAIPFDINYVWRYGNDSHPDDEFSTDMAGFKSAQYIRKSLLRMEAKSNKKLVTKILLEKSVPNSLRVSFIKEIYPDAKFIHLVRDGRAVVESSIRMWQEPPETGYIFRKLKYFPWNNYRYATWYFFNFIKGRLGGGRGQHLWGPRYKGLCIDAKSLPIDVLCARQWRRCVEVALEQLAEVSPANICNVSYEGLMSNTKALEGVCRFLGLSDTPKVLEKYNNSIQRGNLYKWQSRIDSFDFDAVSKEISPTLKMLGYI